MGELPPQTMPPRAEIEAALARIQEWPGLARSPQLARFLRYIVEARLDGNEAGIKAYSIAVDVFGRPPSFDPQSDPIVRVQARRLRAALEEYYAAEGAAEPVRFYLPVGRYIPEFGAPGDEIMAEPGESALAPVVPPRVAEPARQSWLARLDDIVLLVVLVGVALGVAIAMTQILAPRTPRLVVPQLPTVAVAEFTTVTAEGAPGASVAGLAVELVTDLKLFPFIDAVYLQRTGQAASETLPVPFELTGIARTEGSEVQITASLKRAGSDAAVWSKTEKLPLAELPASLDRLSQAFADQLGAPEGPLHAEAIKWLEATPDIASNETEYLCELLFAMYRRSGGAELGERAQSCATGLLRRQPDSATALSISGSLLMDSTRRTQSPLRPDPEPLAEAERQIDRALALEPTSSPVWTEYAFFLERTGRTGEAEAGFISALQLNPSNLDARAGLGRLLSQRGSSEAGTAMADEALRLALSPPYWYHEAPAINALRAGDNAAALAQAEALAVGDAELASAIATVAAYRLGSQDMLNRYIAQLLEVTRFRRFGILPVLRQRLDDAELSTTIGTELAAAGIDRAALDGPY